MEYTEFCDTLLHHQNEKKGLKSRLEESQNQAASLHKVSMSLVRPAIIDGLPEFFSILSSGISGGGIEEDSNLNLYYPDGTILSPLQNFLSGCQASSTKNLQPTKSHIKYCKEDNGLSIAGDKWNICFDRPLEISNAKNKKAEFEITFYFTIHLPNGYVVFDETPVSIYTFDMSSHDYIKFLRIYNYLNFLFTSCEKD